MTIIIWLLLFIFEGFFFVSGIALIFDTKDKWDRISHIDACVSMLAGLGIILFVFWSIFKIFQ